MLILLIAFLIAVGVQSLYLTLFLIAFKKKRPENNHSPVPVSVVVCAHDEEQNLRELVPALLDQEHSAFEVIVVNDRSNDNTYDFLLEETKKDPRLKMVHVQNTPNHVNSKKFAITLGIRAAAHEHILLTDADCRPRSRYWISKMSQPFDNQTQFVLGFSPYEKKPGFLNLFIRFDSFITALQYLSFGWMKNPYMGVGRNLAYRKSLFLEKKGFNNFLHVTGGDDDLFVNQHAVGKNTTIQFDQQAQMLSLPKTTWRGFFYQKLRHLSVGKRYKFGHKLLLSIFMLTWLLTWITGVPLMIVYPYYQAIIAAFAFRWILLLWNVQTLVKKGGLSFRYWAIPVLDFVYPIYYISTGLVALLTKNIRWTK